LKNPLNSIKDKITQYLQLRFEIIRLEIIERSGNVMGYFAFTILTFFLAFTTIFFMGFGLAAWFSNIFDSAVAGYFATAGVMLVATILVIMLSKNIIRFFASKTIWLLTSKKKNEDTDEDDELDDE
jgi:hypothetical protein